MFPLILKDSAGTSSRGVWLVRDEAELAAALLAAEETPLKGHLIAEPYFEGPLYSAETVTWRGRTRLLGVASRQLSPEPARREEAAAFPVAFPDVEFAELSVWIGDVLSVAGHERGFAHTEFILTVDGPEVVEINQRIGGAMIGEALCRSLGVNVYEAMIAMALGEEPALLTWHGEPGPGVAFVLSYPLSPGVLTGWSGLDRLSGLPGSPEWYPTAAVGEEIRHLGDQRACTGILLAEGATAELALHRALAACADHAVDWVRHGTEEPRVRTRRASLGELRLGLLCCARFAALGASRPATGFPGWRPAAAVLKGTFGTWLMSRRAPWGR